MDGLSSQLLAYITNKIKRTNKRTSFKTSLDTLTTPFLAYSLCSLVFDLDLPPYRRFVNHQNAETLLVSCRRYLEVSQSLRKSPLYRILSNWIPSRKHHLFDNAHQKALTALLANAIKYRVENGLIGLPAEANGSKRLSKRRSVKFREKLVDIKCIEPTPDRDDQSFGGQLSSPPLSPPPPPRPSTPEKRQLKELTFIDILLDQDDEQEPEDKLKEKGSRNISLNRNHKQINFFFSGSSAALLNHDEVIENLLAFFTVGLTTLNGALAAVLYYLAAYPEEQEKVRSEVINCLQDFQGKRSSSSKISWEELRSLRYTEAAIREALRLSSPVERLERVVTRKCTVESEDFGSVELPEGTLVHILSAAMHRDGNLFPEPEQFKPSRFIISSATEKDSEEKGAPDEETQKTSKLSEEVISTGNRYGLAFGMGARSCIGLKFALFYLKHLLANVLEQYQIKLVDKCWYHRCLPSQNSNHPLSSRELATRQIELRPLENNKK